MTPLLIILSFFLGIWLLGGIIALSLMFFRSFTHPEWDSYQLHEYFIGFIGSWYTIYVLLGYFNDHL